MSITRTLTTTGVAVATAALFALTGTPASASAAPECRLSQLKVDIGGTQGAAGHSSAPLIYQNKSSSTCWMRAYPGVAALNSHGVQITQARRTLRGTMGGLTGTHLPKVILAPHHVASALVEALNAGPAGHSCGHIPALLTTPPDETHSIKKSWHGGCYALQIHPIVPGITGQG